MPARRPLAFAIACLVALGAIGGSAVGPLPSVADAAALVPDPGAEPRPPTAPTPINVEMGRTATNGPVDAAVLDPVTGRTYIGGRFTEIGRRTGPVAVVVPPDLGDGALVASPPEIAGTVLTVFADDRAGDPGFFVVGRVSAINGAVVPMRPIHRIHLSDGKWVLDPSWVAEDGCHTTSLDFPEGMVWLATPEYLIGGGYASGKPEDENDTGITLFERATGQRLTLGSVRCAETPALFESIPELPELTSCATEAYCTASIGHLAYDSTTRHLLVSYRYNIGPTSSTVDQWQGLAAYDLTEGAGRRAWTAFYHHDAPPGDAERPYIADLAALPGAALVRGHFTLEPGATDQTDSKTLLVSTATGEILQRWGNNGEQSVTTGEVIGPGSSCHAGGFVAGERFMSSTGLVVFWRHDLLCRFTRPSGDLVLEATPVADVELGNGILPPSVPYTAPDGSRFLLGTRSAYDLDASELVDWHVDPGLTAGSGDTPPLVVTDGGVVLGGSFTFVRGQSANGLAALDTAMAPFGWFTSPLAPPTNMTTVETLALHDGDLYVGGSGLLGAETVSVVVLDAGTGALRTWAPAATAPSTVDDIVIEPNGQFWIAGRSSNANPETALERYSALDDGGDPMGGPTLGCLDAPDHEGSTDPTCAHGGTRVRALLRAADGSLYLAGAFGSVNGSTRRGLARLTSTGSLAAWDPDLLGATKMTSGDHLEEFGPRAMVLLGDRLVVGGRFAFDRVRTNGSVYTTYRTPLFVFSASSGSQILPTSPDATPWFPMYRSDRGALDLAHTDSGVFVALERNGVVVLDATTLLFDEAASEGLIDLDWWDDTPDSAVRVLALSGGDGSTAAFAPVAEAASAVSMVSEARTGRMIMGGSLSRWKVRVAGNVARAIITADTTKPTTTGLRFAPKPTRTITGTTVTTQVRWTGADPGGSGVARYEAALSTSGGAFATVSTTLLRPIVDVTLTRGVSYRVRVRAIDFAGNVGAWTISSTLSTSLVQETSTSIKYTSGWLSTAGTSYSGGTTKVRSIKGSAATFTFTGRGIGLVATTAPDRGEAHVYVDGTFIAKIDLRSSTTKYRQLVWQRDWTTSATRSVRIAVVGTAGRPRIDVDAFVVVR